MTGKRVCSWELFNDILSDETDSFCSFLFAKDRTSVATTHESMDERILKKASPTITTQIQPSNVIVLRWNKRMKIEAVARRCLLCAVHFSQWYSLLTAAKLIISRDGLAEYGYVRTSKAWNKTCKMQVHMMTTVSSFSRETVKNNCKKYTHINNWV